MKNKNVKLKIRKRLSKNKVKAYGLIILTLSLTVLSLRAQYSFWNGLFGLDVAIISAAVFEIMRLASLFALLKWRGMKKIIGGLIYVSIALFCGSVAVTSWYSEILEIHEKQEIKVRQEYQKLINEVKIEYAKYMSDSIAKEARNLSWINNNLAKSPESEYWKTRRNQYTATMDELRRELEAFLSEVPENPEAWLEKNTARLGLKIDPITSVETKLSAIERAVQNIWSMNAEQAKKILAMVFVLVVELGIILLAVMSELGEKSDSHVTDCDSIVNYLTSQYNANDIKKFVEKCRDRYDMIGELPKASELAVKLRPIRETILNNGFDEKDFKEFFFQKSKE